MSEQRALWSTRRRSNSESEHPRLNSTTIDNDLVFDNTDLSINRNNLSHQSQQIISNDMPEGYNESPMAHDYRPESYPPIVIKKWLSHLNLRMFV